MRILKNDLNTEFEELFTPKKGIRNLNFQKKKSLDFLGIFRIFVYFFRIFLYFFGFFWGVYEDFFE